MINAAVLKPIGRTGGFNGFLRAVSVDVPKPQRLQTVN